MGSKSHIGFVDENNSVNYIFCLHDSMNNLDILNQHYKCRKKIKQLIFGGHIYKLESKVELCKLLDPAIVVEPNINKSLLCSSVSKFLALSKEDYTFLYFSNVWYWRKFSGSLRRGK